MPVATPTVAMASTLAVAAREARNRPRLDARQAMPFDLAHR